MTRYRQIADELRGAIERGELHRGDRLPSEQRLAERFEVSRGAVRNALAQLQRQGLVVSRPGAGWRVAAPARGHSVEQLRSFAQWAEADCMCPGGRVIAQERRRANAHDARMLSLRTVDDVLFVTRLRTLDDHPVMLERTTYAPWVIPHVERLDPDAPSVMNELRDVGVTVSAGVHRIDTVPANGEDAVLLGVRRARRLLRVRRDTIATDGRPIEYGDDRYAPDAVTLEVHASLSAGGTAGWR